MEEQMLDYVLVPFGLIVLAAYHSFLFYNILRHASRTVIGLNAMSRHQGVLSIMADPMKNGILAVQTLRNNIVASALLAPTAITISSLVGIFAGSDSVSKIVYGNKASLNSSIKRLSISLCFLVAFLCNVQSIRYYAHVCFLIPAPALRGKRDFIEYVAKTLNRRSHSSSLLFESILSVNSFGPLDLWAHPHVCKLLLDIIGIVLLG